MSKIADPLYRLGPMLAPGIPTDLARFAIGFDQRDRARLHALWERIFDSNQWSEGELTKEFESAWAGWNGLDAGRVQRLDRRGACRARMGGRARRNGAVPVEHLHGDAAERDHRRRARRVRRLQPRRPLHVVRGLRAEGARAQAAGRVPRAHRRPHRLRLRADRRALPQRRDRADRGLRARARRRVERPPCRHVR